MRDNHDQAVDDEHASSSMRRHVVVAAVEEGNRTLLPPTNADTPAWKNRKFATMDGTDSSSKGEAERDGTITSVGGGHKYYGWKRTLIINGNMAPETRYPYPASLQSNSQHFCGGALVSSNVVITAAHCTTTATVTDIVLGRYDLDSETDYDYEVMSVIGTVLHPGWDPILVSNDVALLILERESQHQYVTINWDDSIPIEGESLTVMGWGDINPDDVEQQTSDVLQETEVISITNELCSQSNGYATTPQGSQFMKYEGSIGSNMLCAFGGSSSQTSTVSDACQGDSGGPLVRTTNSEDPTNDVLVGLVSWGFSCADSNFPGVYSRMSSFFDDFLKPSICTYSTSPPEYLECPGQGTEEGTFVPAPSPLDTIPTPPPDAALTDWIFADSSYPPVLLTPYPTNDLNYNAHFPDEDSAFTFSPVTGSITCKLAGMSCTIKCSNCDSIKRVALGMNMVSPDEFTIVYTTERGTDEYPEDPSRLVVIGTESTATNQISCDEGCICTSVNDSVLGCGLVAQSIPGPSPTVPNVSSSTSIQQLSMPQQLLLCMILLVLS